MVFGSYPHLGDPSRLTHVSEECATATVLPLEAHNQLMYIQPPDLGTEEKFSTGPSCSKLMTLLVNDMLKFQMTILQIHCYFLLKKSENPLHCKGFSHFINIK